MHGPIIFSELYSLYCCEQSFTVKLITRVTSVDRLDMKLNKLLLLLLQHPHYPLAMYQVSGEYAMFWHASKAGAIELQRVLMETLESMRRAGLCFCVHQIFT